MLARYLALHEPDLRYYVVGEGRGGGTGGAELHVVGELADQDHQDVIDPTGIDAVVVAFDRTLDYRKTSTSTKPCTAARYFATNGDKTYPVPGGGRPDSPALRWPTCADVRSFARTDRRQAVHRDPSGRAGAAILKRSAASWRGDRLETDIRMGHDAGMKTAVVLSGVTTRADAEKASPQPNLVLANLGELEQHLA